MGTAHFGNRERVSADAPIRTGDFAIVVYSDIACPWAHIAVHRLLRTLAQHGLDHEIGIDHRAFSLELVNGTAISSEMLVAEIPACRELEPTAPWPTGPGPWEFATSTLVALEAVQAAKTQGIGASVRLDTALRRAMFEGLARFDNEAGVVEIATMVEGLDGEELQSALGSGRHRAEVERQTSESRPDVAGSPTLILPDGSMHHNPGISMHWDDHPGGRLVIDGDDPDVHLELVERCLAVQPAD